uniref:NADH-ubiquinone oxidoreductase chain 6 n=1 Tax=Deflorita sp. ZJZ-2017 TaxID=1945539 RepID=A0A1Q1MPA2_9ORTH|nr:NADH dehydrogenase subunit 6 [Deflorita sp. ZJZ-2017]
MQFNLLLSLMLVFPFYYSLHPLTMTLIMVLQTLLIALITSTMITSFWFAYILFLVFLGGMLVLFIYIASLASNEMFNPIMKPLLIIFSSIMLIIILNNLLLDSSLLYLIHNNSDMQNLNNYGTYSNESSYLVTKLYNTPTKILTLSLVIYLLLTLIIVVKITDIFSGPLRQQF